MSFITDVIVIVEVLDEDLYDKNTEIIQNYLRDTGHSTMNIIDGHESSGGEKGWIGNILLGSFNRFDIEGFTALLHTMQWADGDLVQLLYHDERQTHFASNIIRKSELA